MTHHRHIHHTILITLILAILLLTISLSTHPATAQVPANPPSYRGRGSITHMAWRADGEMLAVGGYLGTWVYSPDLQQSTWLPTTQVTALAWTPENHIRVVNRQNAIVQRWDMDNLLSEVQIDSPNGQLSFSLAWNPTTDKLASFTNQGIAIWNATDGQLERRIEDVPGPSWQNLVWSPDGQMLAATQGGRVMVWQVEDGERLLDFGVGVISLAWRPDSRTLTGISPNQALSWDIGDNNSIVTLDFPSGWRMAWHPDGEQIALMSCEDVAGIACNRMMMAIWDVDDGEFTSTAIYRGSDITRTTWGPYLTLYDWVDGSLQIWDTDDLQPLTAILDHSAAGVTITSLDWNRDDSRLASIDSTGMVRIWEGDELCTAFAPYREEIYFGDIGGAGFGLVDWHPTERNRLLTTWRFQETGLATIWDIEDCTPTFVHSFPADKAWWSPDGERVAILLQTDDAHIIQLHEISNNEPIATTQLAYPLNDLSWHFDGTRIAGGGLSGEVVVWHIDTNTLSQLRGEVPVFIAGTGASDVVSVAWQPDSNTLISAGQFSGLSLWDMDADTETTLLPADLADGDELGYVYDLTWDTNHNRVAVAAELAAYDVWYVDISTHTIIGLHDQFRPETATALAWSSDGSQLATGAWDSLIRSWTIGDD